MRAATAPGMSAADAIREARRELDARLAGVEKSARAAFDEGWSRGYAAGLAAGSAHRRGGGGGDAG